jgi:hypothetical protein
MAYKQTFPTFETLDDKPASCPRRLSFHLPINLFTIQSLEKVAQNKHLSMPAQVVYK